MTVEVETRAASLDTLAVTIQALHVNGKQMTLSVFRQLPQADAYQKDGSLTPMSHWGLVRYAIKDEGDVWVVASTGGRLYRCNLNSGFNTISQAQRYLDEVKQSLAADTQLVADCAEHERRLVEYRARRARVVAEAECSFAAGSSEKANWVISREGPYPAQPQGWYRRKDVDLERTEQQVRNAASNLETCTRAAVSQAVLRELPQLFIAV